MKRLTLLLSGFLLLAPAFSRAATLAGDAAHPGAAHWLRNELYFGLAPADTSEPSLWEMRWREFLDREVTPRFPDGLTVIDAFGQWKGKAEKETSRQWSKVVIILCEDTRENHDKVDAIRQAYKKRTGDQSVLLVTERVEVSF
ncbi:MAG TPA: DUF3574 domain-containing protein [Opitutaceae bacterium]|jgi:hypothetical protein